MKKGSNMSELSMHELEAQTGEVLPEREALSRVTVINGGHNHVRAVNVATALASRGGRADADATQTVIVG
jgi:hypothetical protein